jgi:hypothetical protein
VDCRRALAELPQSAGVSRQLDEQVALVRDQVRSRSTVLGGVFRRRDLLAWGVDDAILQVMFRRGIWIRLRHGVYVDATALNTGDPASMHRIHLAAAVAASDEVTLAFGPSAALLHGLPLPFPAPDEVHLLRESRQDLRSMTRPSKHPLTIPSMRVFGHAGAVALATTVDGIASVPADIAALTTAPLVSFTRKVGLFDAVLWDGTVEVDDLRRTLAQWPQLGGSVATLAALDLARRGAQSYLETLSRLSLVRKGLPEPLLQVPLHDRDGLIGIVDMLWPGWKVIGEADGALKYQTRQDLVDEKRREDRLRALGFVVVRWMWADILSSADRVAQDIRRAARVAA